MLILVKNSGEATVGECADQILAIPGLCVKADDQSLPENRYDYGPYNYHLRGKNLAYDQAQEDMLNDGLVKVVKEAEDGNQRFKNQMSKAD